MTDRERELCLFYIPGEPDGTLGAEEFYWLQPTLGGDRVIRVYALDVLPRHDGTEYGIYQKRSGDMVRIDAGYGDPFRGVPRSALYDNKADCKAQTHMLFDGWERLRQLQREEGTHDRL